MQTVGLLKEVTIIGKKQVSALAKFDTGAKTTSIDKELAKEAGLGPILKYKRVKSASTKSGHKRAVMKARIKIGCKEFKGEVNVTPRVHSQAKVLIGRDIILNNFVIDLTKTHKGPSENELKL